MKWFLIAGTALAGLALPYLLGSVTAPQYRASCAAQFEHDPEAVWKAISNFGPQCIWRGPMKIRVVQEDQANRPLRMEFITPFGASDIEVRESVRFQRFVTVETSEQLGLKRSWTFELNAQSKGCRLEITEEGEISRPLNRFFANWVFGYHASMAIYLNELGLQLGSAPEHIEKS